jgi:hypothetical protein
MVSRYLKGYAVTATPAGQEFDLYGLPAPTAEGRVAAPRGHTSGEAIG